MHKVFVYGSLLSGFYNHSVLGDSVLLGTAKSPKGFAMLDLGYFPGVIKDDSSKGVVGEVYEVDDAVLSRLDRLEGYLSHNPEGGLYHRIEIDTKFGPAIIYIYNNHYGRSRENFVNEGNWRKYCTKKSRML